MSSIHQHFLHSTSNIDSTFKGTGLHFKTIESNRSQKSNSSNLTLQKDFGRKETMAQNRGVKSQYDTARSEYTGFVLHVN